MADENILSGDRSGFAANNMHQILAVEESNVLPGTALAALVAVGRGGEVARAKADSGDSTYVTGLAVKAGVSGERVHTQYAGPLVLSTEQWDAIAEDTSVGLENGAPYYLSATTAGKITKTLPGAGFAAPVGVATSPTCLLINIGFPSVIIP
jgi:hypothetical protein